MIASEHGERTAEETDDEPHFGLFYPKQYVIRTWYEHRKNGVYPQQGGYDDQDAQLMDDWHAMDMRYLLRLNSYEAERREQPMYPDPSNALNWQEL